MNRIINSYTAITALIAATAGSILGRMGRDRADQRDRGDVPGWVMITLMSAVLVMGLLAVAAPALEGLFRQAIGKVSK